MEIPAETGQPDELSAALMALVPQASAELDQPLTASRALETLKETLLASPAAEILGQLWIDDLVAAIDEFQQELSNSSSGSPGRLGALASPAWNGDNGFNVQEDKSFDQDGMHTDMSVSGSMEEQGDRLVTNLQVSIHLQGIAPDKVGQGMELTITYQGDQDVCPTADGETAGTFSGTRNIIAYGTKNGVAATFGATVTGQISMEADNKDDGTLDQADLSLDGSVNYDVNGQTWGISLTSQASGVNPKDNESILSQLTANKQGDSSFPPSNMEIPTEGFVGDVLQVLKIPLTILVPGNKFAENLWLTANKCVEITATPEELHLDPGDSEKVEVEVTLKDDGGSVAADIKAEAIDYSGQIAPEQANSSPGAKANFTYTAPDDESPGSFSLDATSKAGKAYKEVNVNYPTIEWSGTFTMTGSSNIKDVGSSQGTATFTIRFRADFNDSKSETGDRIPIPFELESDASLSWSGTATAMGTSQPFSGSTSKIITPNYTSPEWPLSLPDGDCLAGEGYVDLSEKKVYLFLLGIGDKTGYGTFNLSPSNTCSYQHDPVTNQVYLVFPLDDDHQIADGSCSDRVSGDMSIQSTRSWHFEAKEVTEE